MYFLLAVCCSLLFFLQSTVPRAETIPCDVVTNHIQQILSSYGKQSTGCCCSHLLPIKQLKITNL